MDKNFQKRIEFLPAYDKRDPDPAKNHGVHGATLDFILLGPLGAVVFFIYTSWHLPHVQAEFDENPVDDKYPHLMCHPIPSDLGYHSLTPHFENQLSHDCDLLPGGKCYYDGSTLNAEPVYERLLREGHDGVWAALEDFYALVFPTDDDA